MEHAAMDHGFMQGMLWGSLLMMSVPILVGIGIGVYALRRWLEDQDESPGEPLPPSGEGGDGGGPPVPRPPRVPELDDADRVPVVAAGPATRRGSAE